MSLGTTAILDVLRRVMGDTRPPADLRQPKRGSRCERVLAANGHLAGFGETSLGWGSASPLTSPYLRDSLIVTQGAGGGPSRTPGKAASRRVIGRPRPVAYQLADMCRGSVDGSHTAILDRPFEMYGRTGE